MIAPQAARALACAALFLAILAALTWPAAARPAPPARAVVADERYAAISPTHAPRERTDRRGWRGKDRPRAAARLAAVPAEPAPIRIAAGTLSAYARSLATGPSVSLAGVVGPLAVKARELTAACGARVISALRHTRVAGTRRLSLHASGRAVDLAGNPACLYARLAAWPGGVSTDYGRVAHVHVSYAPGGPEWAARFRHGHKSKRRGRR